MIRYIKNGIPSFITCLNLISGCLAVYMAFHLNDTIGLFTGLQWVYIFIGAAAVFDFCDGMCARVLHAYSDLGKELDSLCDLVSFGVAPGMMMLNLIMANTLHPLVAFCALLIPTLGAVRLAKFNIDTTQTTVFRGLPIPANAIFWIGFSAWVMQYRYPGDWVVIPIIVLISICMVSRFEMFSLKFKNLNFRQNVRPYAIIIACICFVIFYGIPGLMWTIVLYLFISLFTRRPEETADEK